MQTNKIVIAAGTGFLGQVLTDYFVANGNEVVILTRGNSRDENNVQFVRWNAKTIGNWPNAATFAGIRTAMTTLLS